MHALIAARHGAEAVTLINSSEVRSLPFGVIDTQSLALNEAIGTGGWPRGRIVEIYGPESSGKTTLALHAIAEAQAQGLACAFVDAEHAVDLELAAAIGVDLDALFMSQPMSAEETADIVTSLAESGLCHLVVLDSIAAMTPEAELVVVGEGRKGEGEGVNGKIQPGTHARLMSRFMRRLPKACGKTGCAVIAINQTRSKIGVMMGSPETRPGGNAVKFAASMILRVARTGYKKSGETAVAGEFEATVKKNKLAAPAKKATYLIGFGIEGGGLGIDREVELVDYGLRHGVFTKSGANIYFTDLPELGSYAGTKLECGMLRVANILREQPDMAKVARDLVQARMAPAPEAASETAQGS